MHRKSKEQILTALPSFTIPLRELNYISDLETLTRRS